MKLEKCSVRVPSCTKLARQPARIPATSPYRLCEHDDIQANNQALHTIDAAKVDNNHICLPLNHTQHPYPPIKRAHPSAHNDNQRYLQPIQNPILQFIFNIFLLHPLNPNNIHPPLPHHPLLPRLLGRRARLAPPRPRQHRTPAPFVLDARARQLSGWDAWAGRCWTAGCG